MHKLHQTNKQRNANIPGVCKVTEHECEHGRAEKHVPGKTTIHQKLSEKATIHQKLSEKASIDQKSTHLKACSVPRVRNVFLDQKNFAVFPVSSHISCSKDFAVSLFPDIFRVQRILSFHCFTVQTL